MLKIADRLAPVNVMRVPSRSAATKLAAAIGVLAWGVIAAPHVLPEGLLMSSQPDDIAAETGRRGDGESIDAARGFETRLGGYGGIAYTHPATVSIENPPATQMTIRDFGWIGRPFKSPIYYGLRGQRVPAGMGLGGMLDFTHAKAIAYAEDTATLTGTIDGKPVPATAKVGDVFKHLEFSHGHNIVTLNGLYRAPLLFGGFRPYVGLGAGVSLPHTEVGFRNQNARTYEYQFAGFAGQVLAGVEIPLGRTAIFAEYKFTYAPYSVPLSHEPYGWLLVTDLWRQFQAWRTGERPPGGILNTTLATHHGIAGLMVRAGQPAMR